MLGLIGNGGAFGTVAGLLVYVHEFSECMYCCTTREFSQAGFYDLWYRGEWYTLL